MRLFIQLFGKTTEIEICPESTLFELKKKIENIEGIPIEFIILKQLNENSLIIHEKKISEF